MFRRMLVWEIIRLANAEDDRKKLILERRRARRIMRGITDPLKLMTEEEFMKSYRLNKASFSTIAEDLIPLIPKEKRRDGITAFLKIFIALAFYATGSYQTLVGQSYFHNVSQTTVSRAVRQVTAALNNPRLFKKYVKWPMTLQERNRIKANFYQKFGIPGVLGCIDGTHVTIIRPDVHEERYINRKGHHSLNVMIICDSYMNILAVDASHPGSAHDSIVWNGHPLSAHLSVLSINGENLFLLGGSGYPLRKTMMTPILNAAEGTPEQHYYKKHVTARNTVERCIGVLKARFRCLLFARALHYNPVTAGQIVNACTVLHNLAMEWNLEVPTLSVEEAQREAAFQQQLNQEITVPATQSSGRRVNPDLQEGRDLQRTIVQNLWRGRRQ